MPAGGASEVENDELGGVKGDGYARRRRERGHGVASAHLWRMEGRLSHLFSLKTLGILGLVKWTRAGSRTGGC